MADSTSNQVAGAGSAGNALGPGGLAGGLQDPLQGYDIKVETVNTAGTANNRLVGAFTSLMFKIVNQTETYLPLNCRVPRMLDGEIITVWSLEQGLVEMDVVTNTFGGPFAANYARGRGAIIPRSERFNILFSSNAMIAAGGQNNNDMYFIDTTGNQRTFNNTKAIKYGIMSARVDTFSFGVAAGRHVVANAWQGTAEYVKPFN